MHYTIDGYNLLFKLHQKPGDVESARVSLLSSLIDLFQSLNIKGRVVFDNRNPLGAEIPIRHNIKALEIIFAPVNLTADEYILELLQTTKNTSLEVVITSDRDLATKSKQIGAKTKSIEDFLMWVKKKSTLRVKKTEEKTPMQETKSNIDRLLHIFEKRFEELEK